jgi:hypothetical protein
MVSGKVVAPAAAGRAMSTPSTSRTSRRRADLKLEIIGPPCRGGANGPDLVEPATIGIRRR